jgi:hypothetical protein
LGSIAAPRLLHTTAIREVLRIVQLVQAGGVDVVLVIVHRVDSHNSVNEAPVVSTSVCSYRFADGLQQAKSNPTTR